MKKIKILLSFLLIMSMVCGLAVTTTAAGEDISLAVYKDGSLLGENESVYKGDTITVKLISNIDASAFSVSTRIWYDTSAFTVDNSACKLSDAVTSVFKSAARIDTPDTVNNPTEEEQAKLNNGMLPVNITVVAGVSDVTLPKGEWADLVFTATNTTDSAQFQIQLRGVDSETAGADISANYTAGAIQVKVEDPIIHVESVVLNRASATMQYPGKTMNIKVKTISPDNATDKTVIWASDNETVVTIKPTDAKTAVMTAVSPGTANVTATVDGVTATCPVTVENQLYDFWFDPDTATGVAGSTMTLTPKITPENPDGLTITWKSGDEALATVDGTGVVSLLAAGSTKITVTAKDGYGNSITKEVTLTVLAKPKGDGVYTVKMPENVASEKGETVSLPIVIGTNASEITTFNTVDMVFGYNPDLLTLSSTTIEGFEVKDEAGSVRVQGYGENRVLGTAFTLQFGVKGDETATVTCTQAKVDVSANAITENAANAEILDSDTVITVTKMCTITLPEGMSSEQGQSVAAGTDYTFKVDTYDGNYIYTVTATAGDDTVAVTDNGNGTYEIKNVQNDITVSISKEGKSVSVTVTGDDVTGATTATYDTDYTFTVQKEEGFAYTVTVTIGGAEYNLAEPDADGKYTIPGANITGDVVITVNKTVAEESVGVMYEGNGTDDIQNAVSTAVKGEDFVFVLNKADGYSYTVKYLVGAVGEPVVLTGAEDGSYTIAGDKITEDIIITITKVKVYTVTFEGNGAGRVQNNPPKTVEEGADYSIQVYQHAIYTWTVTASMNGEEAIVLEPLNDYPSGNPIGVVNYEVKNVTGNLTISIDYIGDASKLNIEILPYVEAQGKTLFLVMIQAKTNGIILDAYDGEKFFGDNQNKYNSHFAEKYDCTNKVYMYLLFVDQNQTLTVEDLLPKLTFVNSKEAVTKTNDVNMSQIVDINDAQLVYDIYNGKYNDFTAVSMQKFLNADVNCDMTVDVHDAAAVVNVIP